MPKLTIDGTQYEARADQTVLQVATENGIDIPHFCYHPRLKLSGNCRMCLVEVEKAPKLLIACGTQVRDGMVVHTRNETVRKAREAVLEFLLINHPLDCPVCDQCGECKLQDYCIEYGRESGRYAEEKRTYPKSNIGPDAQRDMNRCVHCTRCVRFFRDVAGQEEFTLSERGGHSEVGTYATATLESPFSMNLVELCPVGALTSKHFRFKGRSWLMDKVMTLCAGCARGCNAMGWSHRGEILRLTPTENKEVNLSWMCNAGRLTIDQVHAEDRLSQASIRGTATDRDEALDQIAAALSPLIKAGEGGKLGVIASSTLTNEDLYLVRRFGRYVIGTEHVSFVPGPADERPFGPLDKTLGEWFIRADKSPNSRGGRDLGLQSKHGLDVKGMVEAAARGKLKGLIVFGDDLFASVADLDAGAITAALSKLELLIVVATHRTPTVERAHMVLPEATFIEKDGTFTNEAGRVQRLRAAIPNVGQSRSAWQTAQQLAQRLNADWTYKSAAQVFDDIAAAVPGYKGLSYASLPLEGALTGDK